MTALAFVDIESSGLQPGYHDVWEVACILRDDGNEAEFVWQLAGVDLGHADPVALQTGRFYERRAPVSEQVVPEKFAAEFARLTAGAYFVGAVPSFDAAFLNRMLRKAHQCPGWQHRLICVENLTAGTFGWAEPRKLSDCARALGVDIITAQRHTALGDARLARDVYDAVVAR